MLGLGIESSCDETAVAVVKDAKHCLANTVFSQIKEHAPFLGVVPEIASRTHLENINFAYEDALKNAGVSLEQIDYIAVAVQPGLIGSLMIGASYAKCLSLVTGLPIVQVDHLEAHLYAPCLEGWVPQYPFLGLLLSGGNSALYAAEAPGNLTLLGDTMDDALGEAFDKAAAVLGLEYPGGPAVEKKALEYTKKNEPSFFTPLLKKRANTEIAFSFSGIKTGVIQAHKKGLPIEKICHDFQETVFELVKRNLLKSVKKTGVRQISAGGGVLANHTLRKRLKHLAVQEGWDLVYPRNRLYCTDNAAMIAAAGYFLRRHPWETKSLDFIVDSKRSGFQKD